MVGGGITGLTTAYRLHRARPDLGLSVIEARDHVGGNIATHRVDGFLLDAGPDSFVRTKPDAVQLVRELGMEDELMTPDARNVYLVHRGRLELMPAGMALAVPTRLGPMVQTPLLSLGGKLRMLADLWLPAKDGGAGVADDESIEGFITRRFGREASERIVGPLLGGIYAGDVSQLSILATFPQLSDLERAHGSLIRGLFASAQHRTNEAAASDAPPRSASSFGQRVRELSGLLAWLRRSGAPPPSPFYSLRRGMGSLIDALEGSLPRGCVRTGVRVSSITAARGEPRGFEVQVEGEPSEFADAVVVTAPAHAAKTMVEDAPLAAELAAIPYVSTATVFVALRREQVGHPLDGVGFLVPRGEGQILAATWVNAKWADRAPEDGVLLRAFLGGARTETDLRRLGDEELVSVACSELTRLMGPLGEPLWTRTFRYHDANPQPVVGHAARLRRIEERLRGLPGLYLAGAAYGGVGVPDCVRQGRETAEQLLARFAAPG